MHFTDFLSILQASVSPVILISGVGLLMLSMTNRFARVVDRSRQLTAALRDSPKDGRAKIESQLKIFLRRARLLRAAISFSSISALMAAVLVIALFLSALLRVDIFIVGAVLFALCLLSLIISLILFLRDLNVSLIALQLDVGPDQADATLQE